MEVRELAEKIYTDIQKGQSTTTSILRDARTLGKLLKNNDFDWVEEELKGYKQNTKTLPSYRIVDAVESKTWTGKINPGLLQIHSDWLYETIFIKWFLLQSVSVLEDLLTKGFVVNTGKTLKTLGLTQYQQKSITQVVTISGQEIKKTLDQVQDNIQEQLAEILAKPTIAKPSIGILMVYSDKFPPVKGDLATIAKFLETGQDHLLAARACRSVLHSVVKALVAGAIPKGYKFTDGVVLKTSAEKSKVKYYLEQKGKSLFGSKKKIVFVDDIFREIYDISSKAIKSNVNIYEANYCVDMFLRFLEQFYRYTDLEPLK